MRWLLLAGLAALTAPQPEEWTPMFNGISLDGWTPKITGYPLGEDPFNTFRVVDGMIQVRYDQYDEFGGHFGHLFYKVPYERYVLRLEYRFVGEQVKGGPGWAWKNSGIMIHGQPASSMTLNQEFPVSAEVQLLGGGETGQRPTANLCTPGTHVWYQDKLWTQHCTNSTSQTYRGEEWVKVELEVDGHGIVKHRVNGKEVLRYSEVQLDPDDKDVKSWLGERFKVELEGGTISLQSESHPVDFRNIEIRALR